MTIVIESCKFSLFDPVYLTPPLRGFQLEFCNGMQLGSKNTIQEAQLTPKNPSDTFIGQSRLPNMVAYHSIR